MQKKLGTTGIIFWAGIAGGTVEVMWVALFCVFSPLQSWLVAEEIARSFSPQIMGTPAVAAGLIIHFALAVLVAWVFAMTLLRWLGDRIDKLSVIGVSVTALAAIWAINFFAILPLVNVEFVMLMPYAVTLASKLGFGVAMGWFFGIRITASPRHTVHSRFVRP
jgi:hypothetical protein